MSEGNKPSYYAVIPADVRYDSRLPAMAKLMYGEITSLSNKYGYCCASNGYFVRLYGIEARTVSRWVSELIKTGHVCSEVIKEKGNQRRLYPVVKTGGVWTKMSIGVLTKKSIPIDKNVHGGMDKNFHHNNTSINNIYINVSSAVFTDFWNIQK